MFNKLQQAMEEIAPGSLEYGIGEILKSLAAESSHNAEIIEQDLSTEGMSIEDCAEHLTDYASKNKQGSGYYMAHDTARRLVCEFYGIANQQKLTPTPAPSPEIIDIMDLL